MLSELNAYLIDRGYDTITDEDGIYIPELKVDIITQDNEYFVVSSNENETLTTNNYDDIILYLEDLNNSDELEDELSKNNYHYEKENARYFSLGTDRIKIIDGRFYLEDENHETKVYINIPSLIGALQSKFLGE